MEKEDLIKLLKEDKRRYGLKSISKILFFKVTKNQLNEYVRILKYSRILQFYKAKNGISNILKRLYFERKFNIISERNNIFLQGNFGKNLRIFHRNILLNQYASIGDNCVLHGNNCIGNDGVNPENCPSVGNNVHIGYGATLIGKIKIADNIIIGANSLVNRSFEEPNVVIAGIPAKVIKRIEDVK